MHISINCRSIVYIFLNPHAWFWNKSNWCLLSTGLHLHILIYYVSTVALPAVGDRGLPIVSFLYWDMQCYCFYWCACVNWKKCIEIPLSSFCSLSKLDKNWTACEIDTEPHNIHTRVSQIPCKKTLPIICSRTFSEHWCILLCTSFAIILLPFTFPFQNIGYSSEKIL